MSRGNSIQATASSPSPQTKVAVAFGAEGASAEMAAVIAALLHEIERRGSIMRATKALKISYSNAWTKLRALECELGCELVDSRERQRGSSLTDAGRDLLARFDRYADAVEEFQRQSFDECFADWGE